jgi:hypothetical protein
VSRSSCFVVPLDPPSAGKIGSHFSCSPLATSHPGFVTMRDDLPGHTRHGGRQCTDVCVCARQTACAPVAAYECPHDDGSGALGSAGSQRCTLVHRGRRSGPHGSPVASHDAQVREGSGVESEPSTSRLPPDVPEKAWLSTASIAPFVDRTGRFASSNARNSARGFGSRFTAGVSMTRAPGSPGGASDPVEPRDRRRGSSRKRRSIRVRRRFAWAETLPSRPTANGQRPTARVRGR